MGGLEEKMKMNNHYKVISDAIKNNDNLYGEAKFDLMLDLTEGFIMQDQEFNPIKFMLACYDEDLVDEDTKSRLLRGLKN